MNKPFVFLFTGQGCQYPNMLKALYDNENLFKRTLDECFRIFSSFGVDLHTAFFSEMIHSTNITQPALFSIEYALATLWKNWGINPNMLIGHSIGEIVACTVSNVLELHDACKLVSVRANLMNSVDVDGGMLAVLAEFDQFKSIIPKEIDIAGFNGKRQIVLSGLKEDISKFQIVLKSHSIRAVPLKVSHPFHSRHMSIMLDDFKNQLNTLNFNKPNIPIISNLSGKIQDQYDIHYFAEHIISPVHFTQSIETVLASDHHLFLECGPAPILSRLIQKDFDDITTISSCEKSDPLCLSIYNAKEEISNIEIKDIK
jgi:acyl transferase domain-containing protein